MNDLQFAGRYQCLQIRCSGRLISLNNEHPILLDFPEILLLFPSLIMVKQVLNINNIILYIPIQYRYFLYFISNIKLQHLYSVTTEHYYYIINKKSSLVISSASISPLKLALL
jgi:hypothetical protein